MWIGLGGITLLIERNLLMKISALSKWVLVGLLLAAGSARAASVPGDAEAAAHGDEAANVQLVQETEQKTPDFVFRQYNLGVLSHYSYLIGSGGEAMIVDPARDIRRYLKDAKELGLKITRVYLTHSHADFVAGHVELAKATGAEIIINEAAKAGYPHKPVKDGDAITFGKVRAVIVTTPGHTPDSTCLYVYHPASETKPALVLTGDTLFIGSVGRPDLMGDAMSAAEMAAMGYHSWKDKLSKLPDDTKFFPAHGAGSLCGANLSDKPVSTIGEQRKENTYLQHKDLHTYVMAVIDGIPDAPQYFKHNAKLNHDGPPLVDWEKVTPPALPAADVAAQSQKGAWLVDVRDAKPFAAGHPADAINIGIRGRFETWIGAMIPWGEPFVLIGSDGEVEEAALRLKRIGYDAPAGFLKGGLDAWKQAKLPVGSLKLVKPRELYQQMQSGKAPIIVDVRLPTEWMGLRIGNVLNIPLDKLFAEGKRLSKEMPVLAVCNSAYRSSMGASVLQKMGFKRVLNMAGGSEAWIADGLPTLSSAGSEHAAGTPPARLVKLPDRLSAAELNRMMMDLPGTFEILDVRPPAHFADFSLPGSTNAAIADVIANPAYLNGAIPLVIVDRDGSLAMAVGGILAQKTQRPIKALFGGLEAYWKESGAPITPASTSSASAPAAKPAAPASSPAKPAASTPAAPETPKKKSAGC
jgi:glyoxylase-like metal-dependent hydrolase (beta-lactamase superfamily II)/rhodanese-related sulfurtransferase